ncbi:hypothetical protein [Streptomyces sp. NPDC058989]|uniref:hypothetical protein n=1 Tax=Streptomyces sp. NPDC058989 TaxID=3346686 RepID=UPI0036B0734F
MHDVEFFPVIITDHPTGDAPLLFDPATVRIARADKVTLGDLVIGQCAALGNTVELEEADYCDTPYYANPRPFDLLCQCGVCRWVGYAPQAVVITDGHPYDRCDVWPAAGNAVIVPVNRLH